MSVVDQKASPAMLLANNYRHGHLRWKGLGLSIENPVGSTRRGVTSDGKAWECVLKDHYGYIKRTEGADGGGGRGGRRPRRRVPSARRS